MNGVSWEVSGSAATVSPTDRPMSARIADADFMVLPPEFLRRKTVYAPEVNK